MNLLDRARISSAVTRYDFWMDVEGVTSRRRRDLRRELRANLQEASADRGARAAVKALGPLQGLARDGVGDATRPRWSVGAIWAGATFGVLMIAWLLSTLAYLDGVVASGVTGRDVTGSVFPWGQEVTARVEPGGGGLSVGGVFPWLPLALAAAVFVIASRPWRLVTGRRSSVATSVV